MKTLTTMVRPPLNLLAMTRQTLQRPLLIAMLTSINRHEWLTSEKLEAMADFLEEPAVMRNVFYYALPTQRERILAMHAYGLAGCFLEPHELTELMSHDPETRICENYIPRELLRIGEHLSVVFDLTEENLETLVAGCLIHLDLSDDARLALYSINIRLISQLTGLTIGEYHKLGLPTFVYGDVRKALGKMGLSFAE